MQTEGGVGLAESMIALILVDISLGLNALHSQSMIHRDIKVDNILLSNTGTFKLADLGCSRIVQDVATTLAGTPHASTAFDHFNAFSVFFLQFVSFIFFFPPSPSQVHT